MNATKRMMSYTKYNFLKWFTAGGLRSLAGGKRTIGKLCIGYTYANLNRGFFKNSINKRTTIIKTTTDETCIFLEVKRYEMLQFRIIIFICVLKFF